MVLTSQGQFNDRFHMMCDTHIINPPADAVGICSLAAQNCVSTVSNLSSPHWKLIYSPLASSLRHLSDPLLCGWSTLLKEKKQQAKMKIQCPAVRQPSRPQETPDKSRHLSQWDTLAHMYSGQRSAPSGGNPVQDLLFPIRRESYRGLGSLRPFLQFTF